VMSKVTVFWVVTLCSDVVGYQHFGGTSCLHFQGEVKVATASPPVTFISLLHHYYMALQPRSPWPECLILPPWP